MVKLKGPLLSESAHGSIGMGLTFSKRRSGNQVRFQKKQRDVITAARTIQRNFFLEAIAAWHDLTDPQKAAYNTRAVGLYMTGYNLYLKEYVTPPVIPIELDYFEYPTDALAQENYVSSANQISWGIINDCSSLVAWGEGEINGAVVSQVTFDGKSTFKLDCTGRTGDAKAYAEKDLGTVNDTYTSEVDVYFVNLGTHAANDDMEWVVHTGTWGNWIRVASEGLFVYDGASYIEIGDFTPVEGVWYTFRFVVNSGISMDIYYKRHDIGEWIKIGTADCSASSGAASGLVRFSQRGYTLQTLTYLDNIRIIDGEYPPSLFCYSEDTIKQLGDYSMKIIAMMIDSLNETLTRTVSPTIDIAGKDSVKYWIRALRTGSNFKVGLRDSGSYIIEHTPNILVSNEWQQETVDISGVSDANKDAINRIQIEATNAGAYNIIYIDDLKGE